MTDPAISRFPLPDPEDLPEDLREPMALAFWALFLAVLLYFTRDDSPGQKKTRALVDGALDLAVATIGALGLPPFAPVRGQLTKLLTDAGLLTS